MGLHFKPSINTSYYLDILETAAQESQWEKFEVFTPETMPERYHFAHSARIAPVYVVPKVGYVLTTRKEGDVGLSKGVNIRSHCYFYLSEKLIGPCTEPRLR